MTDSPPPAPAGSGAARPPASRSPFAAVAPGSAAGSSATAQRGGATSARRAGAGHRGNICSLVSRRTLVRLLGGWALALLLISAVLSLRYATAAVVVLIMASAMLAMALHCAFRTAIWADEPLVSILAKTGRATETGDVEVVGEGLEVLYAHLLTQLRAPPLAPSTQPREAAGRSTAVARSAATGGATAARVLRHPSPPPPRIAPRYDNSVISRDDVAHCRAVSIGAIRRFPSSIKVASLAHAILRTLLTVVQPRPGNDVFLADRSYATLVESVGRHLTADAECTERGIVALGGLLDTTIDDLTHPGLVDQLAAVRIILRAWRHYLAPIEPAAGRAGSPTGDPFAPRPVVTWAVWALLNFASGERNECGREVAAVVDESGGTALIAATIEGFQLDTHIITMCALLLGLLIRLRPSVLRAAALAEGDTVLTSISRAMARHPDEARLHEVGARLLAGARALTAAIERTSLAAKRSGGGGV